MSKKITTKQIGAQAEQIALDYLLKQGLTFIKRNFHSRFGEIDLIMKQQDLIIFIEVRCRNQRRYIDAIETVDFYKQQKIIKTAKFFLCQEKWANYYSYRFDVLSINGRSDTMDNIIWVPHAFEVTSE